MRRKESIQASDVKTEGERRQPIIQDPHVEAAFMVMEGLQSQMEQMMSAVEEGFATVGVMASAVGKTRGSTGSGFKIRTGATADISSSRANA